MKITSKSRTAVMAMVYLASKYRNNKTSLSLSEIAKLNNLSLSFLEQIFSKLRKKELVTSMRGINGGYTIGREPKKISVYDIIDAIEEVDFSTRCRGHKEGCVPDRQQCLTHNLWASLDENNKAFLSAISLQSILNNNFPQVVAL